VSLREKKCDTPSIWELDQMDFQKSRPTKRERIEMRRILAIGGFSTDESESIAAGYIRDLTGKDKPKVCFLSTPSGDSPSLIDDFDRRYRKLGCETSNVCFFGVVGNNCVRPDAAAEHLIEQDAIFVSGGHPRCALGLWNEWGLEGALGEAWERGVLLSGVGAGAICWFQHHVPIAANRPWASPARQLLGFLPGNCGVHYHAAEGSLRKEVWESMGLFALPSAIAIDDDAAVLYEDRTIAEVLSWRDNATAYRLECGPVEVSELPLTPKVIGSIAREPDRVSVSVDIEAKRRCVGQYQLMSSAQLKISIEDERLFAQYGGQPKFEIFPESETEYFWKVANAQVTFKRDSEGNVTSLIHHQNGRDIQGVRLEG
jgi:peptidase E